MTTIEEKINDKYMDLVIDNFIEYYRFYHPEIRTYIQSYGRSKLKNDICETLINHDIEDKIEFIWKCSRLTNRKNDRKRIQKTIKNYLMCLKTDNLTFQIKYLIKIVILNNMLIEGFL